MDNYNTNLTAEEPDANVNELPVHNTMQSGDRLLGSGTAEEFLIDYEALADAILNKLTTKEYAGLGTAAKNIPAAIKELAQGNIPVTFTKATTRSEILSTEKLPTLFGKISRWLSDLGAAAFCKVANNDTTTAEGYVADARAVNALGKEVDELNSSLEKMFPKNFTEWMTVEPGNYSAGEKRFINSEAKTVYKLIFVFYSSKSSGEACYEYVTIETPYRNLESLFYTANTNKGPLEIYYAESGVIDLYKVPSLLKAILYVKY